jgi:FSR family fosmidomycin resistance protein-like MFS transporter
MKNIALTITGIAHAVNHSFQLMIAPLLPFLAVAFKLNLVEIGLLVTAFVSAYGIGQFPAGFLADRIGAKNLIIMGIALCGMGALISLIAVTLSLIAVGFIIMGIGGSTYHPSGLTMLSHAFDEKGRGQAMGIHGLAGSVGQIASPIASGGIAVLQGWKTTFLIYAVMGISFSILASLFLKGKDINKKASPQSSKQTNSVKSLLSKAIVIVFLLAIFQGFLYQITTSFLILYLVNVRSYNVAVASLMLSLLLAAGGVGQYVAGAFSDRVGRKKVLVVLTTATIITVLPIPFVANEILITLVLAFGFFLLGIIPTTNALMSDLAKASFGVLFGIYYLFAFGVSSAGPPIAGFIAENYGFSSIFIFSGLLGVMCLVITLLITETGYGGRESPPASTVE